MMGRSLQFLRQYSNLCAAAGDESAIRDRIRSDIGSSVDDVSVNPLGNLTAVKGGRIRSKSLLLTAHMDEIAFMVRSIEKNGTVGFYPVGGVVSKILPGTSVALGKRKIPGVIGTKAPHLLMTQERDKVPDIKELFIDIGASSKEEVKDVEKGDYIYFRSAFLAQGALCFGKAFDDRAGCAALTTLLRQQRDQIPGVSITAVYTAQEEVGLRGASTAAFGREGVLFNLNLEGTTCSDRDMKKTYSPSTELGGGPAVTVMDRTMITNRKLLDWVLGIARARSIPCQLKRTATGGTDAGIIHLTGEGIPSVTVAVPVRYIHAPWGILSRKDFNNYMRLAAAVIEEAHRFKALNGG
jgi:endoglucanase